MTTNGTKTKARMRIRNWIRPAEPPLPLWIRARIAKFRQQQQQEEVAARQRLRYSSEGTDDEDTRRSPGLIPGTPSAQSGPRAPKRQKLQLEDISVIPESPEVPQRSNGRAPEGASSGASGVKALHFVILWSHSAATNS